MVLSERYTEEVQDPVTYKRLRDSDSGPDPQA